MEMLADILFENPALIHAEFIFQQAEILEDTSTPSLPLTASMDLKERGDFSNTPQFTAQWSIALTLLSNSPLKQREEAALNRDNAKFLFQWEEQRQMYILLGLCLDYSREKQVYQLDQQSLSDLENQVQGLETLAAQSRITGAEFNSALARLYRRKAALAEQEQLLGKKKRQIDDLLRKSGTGFLNYLDWTSLESLSLGDSEDLPQHRPDLLSQIQGIQKWELQQSSLRSLGFPTLSLSVGMNNLPFNPGWEAELSLRYSLVQRKEKRLALERNRLGLENAERQLTSNLQSQQTLLDQSLDDILYLEQSLENQQQAESYSLLALKGVEREFLAGHTTSQDYLTAMSNHRVLARETLIAQWDLRGAKLYACFLLGELKL